jgi:hypothetical protein
LRVVQSEALRETIARLEETGSPVITDGEQTEPSFATYPLAGVGNLTPNGVVIPFTERSSACLDDKSLSRGGQMAIADEKSEGA